MILALKSTKFFIKVLIIYITANGVAAFGPVKCVSRCKCKDTTIKCTDRMLGVIPDFKRITVNPNIIDLSSNDIEEVKATNFAYKKLENLKHLYLNDNSILNVDELAFSSLIDLEHLDLSNNLLEDVPKKIIQRNENLTTLNLSGNSFSFKAPELISSSLVTLEMSFSKIPAFSKDNLKNLPNLEYLYLYGNNLMYVDYSIFVNTKLTHIDLFYNSWQCHCNTIKLFDFLVEHKLTTIDRPIDCIHSNKKREDIYGALGPMRNNELCNNNNFTDEKVKHVSHYTKNKHEVNFMEPDNTSSKFQYEVMIIGVAMIGVLVVVSMVSITIIVRTLKTTKPKVYTGVNTSFV